MPIYEYVCSHCHHEMEALQKMSDAPLQDCPECGKPALKKKISAAAFRLKGGGWYETDFKTGSKKNLAGEGAKSSDAAKSSEGSKSSSGSSSDSTKSSTSSSGSTAS